MNGWQRNTTTISKLRVAGERRDGLEMRLRLENTFAAIDFTVVGLPPQTILCVKKMRDPLPKTLRLKKFDATRPDVWRSSVTREIERLHRRAAHPVRETVPAAAESVVFADDAELLACLASDWCENTLAENWWWRGLFPNLPSAQTVAQIWMNSAESAPAALRILAQTKRAVQFINKLQPPETEDLLRQLILVFGLENLRKALFETIAEKPNASSENRSRPSPKNNAPWLAFAPETESLSSNFARQTLLGIGLMLARVPRIVRSHEFARTVKNFRLEAENNVKFSTLKTSEILSQLKKRKVENQPGFDDRITPGGKADSPPIRFGVEAETPNFFEDEAARIIDDTPPFEKGLTAKPDFPKSAQSAITPPENRGKSKHFSFEDRVSETIFERREDENKTADRQSEKSPGTEIIASEFVEKLDGRQIEISVETDFGGVFYLLNLGLYLKLYRDFADTETTEIDLNIWDFVAFLSLKLTGAKIKLDNIWRLLAQFAGREPDAEIAPDFDATTDWRVPTEWLETFPTDEKWTWAQTAKRLVVRRPSGFSVIDIKADGDAGNQLNDELKVYRKDFTELAESDFPNASEASKTWLKNLTEYVEVRLRQALNTPAGEEISRVLFERRATIVVTETHLDVTFRLADLPFAVRLSGLDRDAGWIPAAGKYVVFHYV